MSTAAIRTAPFTCRLLTETLGRSRGRLPGLLACFECRPGGDADRACGRSCCRRATAGGDKHEPVFAVDVTNRQGEVVATVEKTLYVRRKPGR